LDKLSTQNVSQQITKKLFLSYEIMLYSYL